MLLRFRVKNFRSFRDEQEFSLIASAGKELSTSVFPSAHARHGVLPVAAIYGANAAGKTNLVLALQFMTSAVQNSHVNWKPEGGTFQDPFRLDESATGPSLFEIDFEFDTVRYQYGFVIDSVKVLEEWLFAFPGAHKQTLFSRGRSFKFGKRLSGENRAIENLTRKNSLFLSAAAQNNHEMLSPIYQWLSTSISFVRGPKRMLQDFTAEMCRDEKTKSLIETLLSNADLGIVGVEIGDEDFDRDLAGKLMQAIKSVLPSEVEMPKAPKTLVTVKMKHRLKSGQVVPFSSNEESQGTIAYFGLLGKIVQTLRNGGILCVDELDASLHPRLAMEVVRLFNDSSRNTRGAQLIFNTHDTNLLSPELLRRDEVWFTEKGEDGSSHLYPLSDFKPRKNENLENGYLQGRYGAIPFVNETHLLEDEVSS